MDHLQDVDGVLPRTELAFDNTAGLTTPTLEGVRLSQGDVLPVVGAVATVPTPELEVPAKVLALGSQGVAILHLSLDLKTNLHHF